MTTDLNIQQNNIELLESTLELIVGGIPPELLDPHTNEWGGKPGLPSW